MNTQIFVPDTNVFVDASRRYYPFDLAPGFWDALARHAEAGIVQSIDKVEEEIKRGGRNGHSDALVVWAERYKSSLFQSTDVPDVLHSYRLVISWAQGRDQYMEAAKAEFAAIADGWVIAFALANGFTVVTEEVPAPGSKRRIKIPDVCNAFNVPWVNGVQMLRNLGVVFR